MVSPKAEATSDVDNSNYSSPEPYSLPDEDDEKWNMRKIGKKDIFVKKIKFDRINI